MVLYDFIADGWSQVMLDRSDVNSYTERERCSNDYSCLVSPFQLLIQMLGYHFFEYMIIGRNDSRKSTITKLRQNLGNIENT